MAGEMVAFRRAALGVPIAQYASLIDDARLNKKGSDSSFVTASSAVSVTVTASATPHTVGAYTELITSTTYRIRRLIVAVSGLSATGTNTGALLNIATGAAAAEVVLIPNINIGGASAAVAFPSMMQFEFMRDIPAGTRISCSMQAVVISDTALVSVVGTASGGPLPSGTGPVTTYGADTATSSGTAFTAAGGNNTPSAWTAVTAATTAFHKYLTVSAGVASAGITNNNGSVDIAIGASGSEVVIGSAVIQFNTNTSEAVAYVTVTPAVLANIPAGTRVAVRYQSSASNVLFWCVHGQ